MTASDGFTSRIIAERYFPDYRAVNGDEPGIDRRVQPRDYEARTEISTPTCSHAGQALTPNQHVFTSCGAVVDGRTGNSLATVMGISGDEIWYRLQCLNLKMANQLDVRITDTLEALRHATSG